MFNSHIIDQIPYAPVSTTNTIEVDDRKRMLNESPLASVSCRRIKIAFLNHRKEKLCSTLAGKDRAEATDELIVNNHDGCLFGHP
jgi:hypothetical protein